MGALAASMDRLGHPDMRPVLRQTLADGPPRLADRRTGGQADRRSVFSDPSGDPAWKEIPSWFIYDTGDRAISAQLLAVMAQRSGSRHAVIVDGASHAPLASQAEPAAALIDEAASGAGG
ncbi:MAG: alpha/beta hydrolase family protein [Ramlibacter sp.]|nr:alpha/beta hydrolase family protein [Ramlibacter sp.]